LLSKTHLKLPSQYSETNRGKSASVAATAADLGPSHPTKV
jgi:hypothetical protein